MVTVIAVLAALAPLMYGFSGEVHRRLWQDIFDRPGGPMSFRFILQPLMAAIAALHDGAKDARLGRQPYLTRLLSGSDVRSGMLSEAVVSTGRILPLGLVMDGIYQFVVLKTFYPGRDGDHHAGAGARPIPTAARPVLACGPLVVVARGELPWLTEMPK